MAGDRAEIPLQGRERPVAFQSYLREATRFAYSWGAYEIKTDAWVPGSWASNLTQPPHH